MSIDRPCTRSSAPRKVAADLLVQEYGRYFDMPTVCFRGGCLTGPNHAGAQLHGFLAYLMKCTVDRRALHRLRLRAASRCATTSTAPTSSAPSMRFHASPARRRRSTTSAAAARRNCSMLEAIAHLRADRRPRAATGSSSDQARDRRPPLVDQRPRRSSAPTTRLGARATASRRSCARSTRRTSNAGRPRRCMKLSVVIPAHNEEGSIADDGRRGRRRASRREEIDHEIVVRRRLEHGRDGRARGRALARATPDGCAACRSPYPHGFGFAVRAGLEAFEGDAVAIVMADGSDEPRGPGRLPPAARGGLRLRVRLALHARRAR